MAETDVVRALTLRRPWSELVISGIKRVENRSWTTTYRGALVIHAGKAFDWRGLDLATKFGVDWQSDPKDPFSGYLGAVYLNDVHPAADCCRPWGEPEGYHWVVNGPQRFERPIPGKGRLGLFTPPYEALEAIALEVHAWMTSEQGER